MLRCLIDCPIWSHPSWVCGLKRAAETRKADEEAVTPFVGVWIETESGLYYYDATVSHTLRGCVD